MSLDDSHDLTQTTFLRVWQTFDQFQPRGRDESWLFTIARNVWRNHIRDMAAAKRASIRIPLHEASNDSGSSLPRPQDIERPLLELISKERRAWVIQAIKRLPSQMRHCFLFRYGQGCKTKDIARLMGLSVQSVKSHLHQGRKKLVEMIEQEQIKKEEGRWHPP